MNLGFFYSPDAELSALGREEIWCDEPGRVEDFRGQLMASPALASCKDRGIDRVDLSWGRV